MKQRSLTWLVAGDIITLFLLTVAGFASHQELSTAGWRLLTTFLPLCAAWAVSALVSGLYRAEVYSSPSQLWRALWGMLLAGPLAAFLRGIWLNQPIIPVFVLVLTGFGMFGMVLWRFLFWFLIMRRALRHG
ncbi:MAG: DUF3054 domain-containing protein [Anaerolineales bacterium]|nr:DUF3054 domain-containing protein [Anaerolineales bacterium]MDW8160592.1 DUF3054 domain-containing protein [Anaerolineales bacterium]